MRTVQTYCQSCNLSFRGWDSASRHPGYPNCGCAPVSRSRPIAVWEEGFVSVSVSPPSRELACELARRWPDSAEMNMLGTCLLVRAREDVIARLIDSSRPGGVLYDLQTSKWALAFGAPAVFDLCENILRGQRIA